MLVYSPTQAYNRYSYVRNNPLKYTDPTGHSWFSKFWKKVKKWVKAIVSVVVAAVVAVVAPVLIPALAGGGFWATVGIGALAGAAGGAVATGTLKGALKGALFGALSAGVAFGVTEVAGHLAGVGSAEAHMASLLKTGLTKVTAIKTMLHGLSRGIISKLQGGTFKVGFFSGLSGGFDVGTNGYGGFIGRTAIMAIVGGTASALGGGKFANGAISGAFVHMFNAEGLVDKAISFGQRALTVVGGALQMATGGLLIASGVGTPLGALMIGLGANNIIAGTTGYNAIQSGLTYVSDGALGAKTYAAIDLAAGGASMVTKIPRVVDSVIFGKQIAYQPIYQTTSRYGLGAEALVAANTVNGASQ